MAVDIKSLRVGSHILVNSKRVRVCGIRPVRSPFNVFQVIIQHEEKIFSSLGYVPSTSNTIEPIPITPDLLKELGFVNTSSTRRITYTKGSEYEDSWIEFKNLKDRWEIFVSKDNWDGRTVVRYLHEAELFLGLHNIELIKE